MADVDRSAALHGFLAASLLTIALLLPHSRLLPVALGIGLAALLRWSWRLVVAPKDSSTPGTGWRDGSPPQT
jgi:hypothetical protein